MFAEALKQVGLEQSEDGNSVVINVQTVGSGSSEDSDDLMGGLSRGRADLCFFGRDRFAIQVRLESSPQNVSGPCPCLSSLTQVYSSGVHEIHALTYHIPFHIQAYMMQPVCYTS